MDLTKTFMMASGEGAEPKTSINYETVRSTPDSGRAITTFSWNNVPIGNEHPNRYIVLTIHGFSRTSNDYVPIEVTLGGSPVTMAISSINTTTGSSASVGIIAYPTGTTGNIQIIFSGGIFGSGVGVYSLITENGMTPHDTNTNNVTVNSSKTIPINAPTGSAYVAVSQLNSGVNNAFVGIPTYYSRDLRSNAFARGGSDASDTDTPIDVSITSDVITLASWL